MNRIWYLAIGMAVISGACSSLRAQDNVTIPKSRLEELERKEAELERLRGKSVAPNQSTPLDPGKPAEATIGAPAAPVSKPAPPIASLPPFVDGQTIEATELAGYFRRDRALADQRFHNRKMVVRGEIVSLDTTKFKRNYQLILEGNDRDTRVRCDLVPPDRFKAVYTVEEGSRLVGLQGETRVPIARLGDKVRVTGTCKGLLGRVVLIQGKEFEVVR